MFGILNSWTFLVQHPLIGIVVFVAVSAGVITVLSGGKLAGSLSGLFRIVLTIFSTPFVFLRDALTVVRGSEEADQDYKQSRVFMLFRLSRIQYMGLLVLCLLMLSSGITTSLISLYPAAEVEQQRMLREQVTRLEGELKTAKEAVNATAAPGFLEGLETQRTQAREAYEQKSQSNYNFIQNATVSGPLISQLANAGSTESVERLRAGIEDYMADCPRGYNWRGMTVDTCRQYRSYAIDLANRKAEEFRLARAASDADRAWREAGSAAEIATERQNAMQAAFDNMSEQYKQASPWDPERMAARIVAALLGLLGTFGSVILFVWLGATAISVLSWIILMMRAGEIAHTDELKRARPADE